MARRKETKWIPTMPLAAVPSRSLITTLPATHVSPQMKRSQRSQRRHPPIIAYLMTIQTKRRNTSSSSSSSSSSSRRFGKRTNGPRRILSLLASCTKHRIAVRFHSTRNNDKTRPSRIGITFTNATLRTFSKIDTISARKKTLRLRKH